MPNVGTIINSHNSKLIRDSAENFKANEENKCSCPKKVKCSLDRDAFPEKLFFQATVECGTSLKTYVGLTATTFKARLANHKASFKSEDKRNSTELSKHIWNLKYNKLNYAIRWKIICQAPHYSNKTKRCHLCISEKFSILRKPEIASLNKRNELVSKCRHKDIFLLRSTK